ncbi:hypothetical protein [Bradyrhizobium sp. BWC-3-1]|uniref:hypothetical protein n=1 Tax=Bradyrhizobium sp. BWC-3-1 TaxID=3080012 RepID=UPI00293E6FA9|nr:hypothetical protein [Bradyrhizobium sp. BWC-3-1]WOH57626.1 hypothetical protein RX329_36515 [Bradyrhizobium sp. BWC-3-1]
MTTHGMRAFVNLAKRLALASANAVPILAKIYQKANSKFFDVAPPLSESLRSRIDSTKFTLRPSVVISSIKP